MEGWKDGDGDDRVGKMTVVLSDGTEEEDRE